MSSQTEIKLVCEDTDQGDQEDQGWINGEISSSVLYKWSYAKQLTVILKRSEISPFSNLEMGISPSFLSRNDDFIIVLRNISYIINS